MTENVYQKTKEDQILEWLLAFDDWRAKEAAEIVDRFGSIQLAYCEFTGGYIGQDSMNAVLSEECFSAKG